MLVPSTSAIKTAVFPVAGLGTRVPEPVLIVTEDGGKGWRVSRYLQQHGVEAANLVGGIFAWEAAGLPVER